MGCGAMPVSYTHLQLEKKEMKILPQEKIGMYLAEAERRGLLAAFYLELTTGPVSYTHLPTMMAMMEGGRNSTI